MIIFEPILTTFETSIEASGAVVKIERSLKQRKQI